MALSVIVPCLNEADIIVAALKALQPLQARGAEVIVVDGGSRDLTVAYARDYADQVLVTRRGRAMQMNAGAAVAHREILLFLHADCMLPEAADRLIVDGLARQHRSWGRFDVVLTGGHRLLGMVATMMNLRSRLTGIATGDQAIFVTRSLFEAAGRFPEIALMEDVALSKRLKRFGPPLCVRHPVSASGRRWERDGLMRTILLMWRLRLAYALGADPDRLALRYTAHGD